MTRDPDLPPLGRDPSTSTPATKPIRQSQSAQLPTRKQSQPTGKAAKASSRPVANTLATLVGTTVVPSAYARISDMNRPA